MRAGHAGRALLVGLVPVLVAGCLAKGQPVVSERSPTERPLPRGISPPKATAERPLPVSYIVRKGDTLYSIAWRYQLDHVALARINGIAPPYVIVPGQRVRLRGRPSSITPRPEVAKTPQTEASQAETGRSPVPRTPAAKPPARQPPVAVRTPTSSSTAWVMPVSVAPSGEFTARRKGLDFTFDRGTHPIKAAAAGTVVYAGNGLGGYEHLIILRHTADLLSAYSFNGRITIREGAVVKAAGKLADILVTGRTSQKFHFELRRSGNPIDPRSLIR